MFIWQFFEMSNLDYLLFMQISSNYLSSICWFTKKTQLIKRGVSFN